MKISILIKIQGILNMNKLLVTTLILIISGLSHANQSRYVLSDDKQLCEAASYFAAVALEGHYRGEDKKILLDYINESQEIPNIKKTYFKMLLNEAYNKPIYSSEEEMKKALMKFHDDTSKDCMKKALR
ncbi:hypothetical protein [Acinetobacter larvae]|uniref:Uncharacterized protein n=1 Tax=Acinetobacter larvae TaxID=1789224 RepID=A0A1B2LZX6_9GAMM|nr:hypothetical protein [Acinetobacter larvae]AOA58333.1 hypothetical protein BFG52_08180 [Acinetobacter larvae]